MEKSDMKLFVFKISSCKQITDNFRKTISVLFPNNYLHTRGNYSLKHKQIGVCLQFGWAIHHRNAEQMQVNMYILPPMLQWITVLQLDNYDIKLWKMEIKPSWITEDKNDSVLSGFLTFRVKHFHMAV